MARNPFLSDPDDDPVISELSKGTVEISTALGLIRVLTLLPLYDHFLDEVEQHLARALEAQLNVRRQLEERVVDRRGRLRPA
jgi:hypothetical protein